MAKMSLLYAGGLFRGALALNKSVLKVTQLLVK